MGDKQRQIVIEYEEYFIRNIKQRFNELKMEGKPMCQDSLMGLLYYCRPKKN